MILLLLFNCCCCGCSCRIFFVVVALGLFLYCCYSFRCCSQSVVAKADSFCFFVGGGVVCVAVPVAAADVAGLLLSSLLLF